MSEEMNEYRKKHIDDLIDKNYVLTEALRI